VAYLPVTVGGEGAPDAVALSAHKLGGPVGVGALVAPRDLPLAPVTFGGGQERRVRSGTVPAALIAAFAVALDEAVARRAAEAERLGALSAGLVARLLEMGATVSGPADPAGRAPHIVHAVFPGCRGDDLLLLLDRAGIAVSTGSACTAGVAQASHVLVAMGYPAEAEARWGLRFSFGAGTAQGDLDALVVALGEAVARIREGGLSWPA
jgi:cysteine desulfurase